MYIFIKWVVFGLVMMVVEMEFFVVICCDLGYRLLIGDLEFFGL